MEGGRGGGKVPKKRSSRARNVYIFFFLLFVFPYYVAGGGVSPSVYLSFVSKQTDRLRDVTRNIPRLVDDGGEYLLWDLA